MRRLLFLLCLLASVVTASASYDVVYWNTNFDSQFTPQYGQKILVSPIYFSNSIAPLQPRMYTCGIAGSTYAAGFIISNMLSGRYTFDIQSTPRSTPLIFVVPDGSGTYTLSIADKVATPAGTGFPTYADITNYVNAHAGSGGSATLTWVTGLSNEFNIFNGIASNTVAACAVNYQNDQTFGTTNTWQPSPGVTYPFFFLRDTVMSMGAAPHLFSALDFTNILMQAKSLQPSQVWGNTGMDSGIAADGSGNVGGGNGEDYDGVFYLTRIAYEGWKKTGAIWFYTNCQTQISNAMAFYGVSNHLAYITNSVAGRQPGWGFEDSVQLYGVPAMLNGLRHEACRELSEMHAALGHTADALWYTNECGFIRTNLQAALWDSSRGLFFACTTPTTNATKYDLAASAYIAMVGACSNGIQQQIGFTLADYLTAGPFKHGSMAHLPSNQNWFEVLNGDQGPGAYQNGGYWPLLGVYAAQAIRNVNKELADNSIRNLAGRYAAQSSSVVPPEWENGTAGGAPQYLVSGCAPLAYFLGIYR